MTITARVNELTIGKYSRVPDTYTAAYDDGTSGPRRGRRVDAERDYLEANDAPPKARPLIERYRRDSAVFRPWVQRPSDFHMTENGKRYVLVLDTITGGTILAPWLGPDTLTP